MSAITLDDLRRVQFKPGDRCVLTVPRRLSRDEIVYLKQVWRLFAGDDVPLFVCDGGVELHVIASLEEPRSSTPPSPHAQHGEIP